jgi:hypothetical protein
MGATLRVMLYPNRTLWAAKSENMSAVIQS